MMQTLRRTMGGILLIGALFATACSSSESREERNRQLEALAAQENWEELETQVEFLESKGQQDPTLDFYMGWAALQQDEDRPAEQRFERAVKADSSRALEVARLYRAAALRDLDTGWDKRAALRMRRAYELDGITEMGALGGPVAGLIFKDREFSSAIPLLRHLVETEAPGDELRRWEFALGFSLEECGLPEAALEQYRRYWKRWYNGEPDYYHNHVSYRVAVILLGFADERMEHGDCVGALQRLDELEDFGCHADQRSAMYLRRGRCLEELNRIDEARESYREALRYPGGEGGGAHEEARERLRVLSRVGDR